MPPDLCTTGTTAVVLNRGQVVDPISATGIDITLREEATLALAMRNQKATFVLTESQVAYRSFAVAEEGNSASKDMRILGDAMIMLQYCLEGACDAEMSKRNARDLHAFLEQRKLALPGDFQRLNLHPLDVLLDLAINWHMPLWFSVMTQAAALAEYKFASAKSWEDHSDLPNVTEYDCYLRTCCPLKLRRMVSVTHHPTQLEERGFKRSAQTVAPFYIMVVRIEKERLQPSRPRRPTLLLLDAPSRERSRPHWKRRMLHAFVFVAILSPLCLAPGADAFFLKKKIKLLKASKGKFGLRPQPQPHHHAVGPAYLPPPQWVPPPHVVPHSVPPPVAHWGFPGDYSGWVPPPPQPAPAAHGWVAGPPALHAAPSPPQAPHTTYVVEAQVPTGTAFASTAGKGAHRLKGPHEYQYTLHCPYELYVQVEPNSNNKDRW
ncbi:hypothetical protein HPB51_003969 [Rhipicephalus microplus]|uniref:Uncharacterized protein n=1 Tax=Rhipicephalus microplus TaxID=6941 RepID=A0A9J6DSD7_RHIMP|nr:hypothetical protein HPB51_003969 [Rhipicephalus microplus]